MLSTPPRNHEVRTSSISSPFSTKLNTFSDISLTTFLWELPGCFESYAEVKLHEKLLVELDGIVKKWVRDLGVEKKISSAENLGGKVVSFGSYRLGVHSKDSDIDALCVVPRHVTREDFFLSFVDVLKTIDRVTNVLPVPGAYVPILRFYFDGVNFDLLFTRLSLKEVSDDQDLLDMNIINNLDFKSIRSVNGYKSTVELLKIIPNEFNFCITLRAIKTWAKNRGMYSSMMGFLGGIGWTLLLVKVCQLFPTATPSTLLLKFFSTFKDWDWDYPVMIEFHNDLGPDHCTWNSSINKKDWAYQMAIITPIHPPENSSHNVSKTALRVIQEEFNNAYNICSNILDRNIDWHKFFKPTNFFHKYEHFIVVEAVSLKKTWLSEQDERQWVGLVGSRIRLLVTKLEIVNGISLARVWPNSYISPKDKSTRCWFLGLDWNKDVMLWEVVKHLRDWENVVSQYGLKSKVWKVGMEVSAEYKLRRDLDLYLPISERWKLHVGHSSKEPWNTTCLESCPNMRNGKRTLDFDGMVETSYSKRLNMRGA